MEYILQHVSYVAIGCSIEYIYMYIFVYIYVYIYMRVYMYIYMCIYIHTSYFIQLKFSTILSLPILIGKKLSTYEADEVHICAT